MLLVSVVGVSGVKTIKHKHIYALTQQTRMSISKFIHLQLVK